MIRITDVAAKCILPGALALAVAVPSANGWAATFQDLYVFSGGSDGANPDGALIRDDGNLYGTTYFGGADNLGVVFELARDGTESVLHSFTGGSDGADPEAGLIADAKGNLYGTTYGGGTGGCGSVFKVTAKGRESVLYAFGCGIDGADPSAVIIDASGNLYGTTYAGGTSALGTVFKLAPDGTKSVLYAFKGGSDGADPYAGLIADAKGNLYGTTYGGGTPGFGTVFKLAADGTESVLYAFKGGSDGANPFAGVIANAKGNLYGTTYLGGSSSCGSGCGTVFRLAHDGTETVLHSFSGGSDGTYPYASLIMDASGDLLGTTLYGGSTDCSGNGCGTIFKVARDGTKKVLYALAGSDGAQPSANLIADKRGNLYGTTFNGGNTACGGTGCGVVFKLKR